MNDKLWDNLYWTAELTRPDHLAKILNTIVRKEGGNSEGFIYDRQAAKDAMKSDLTQNDVSQNDVTRHDITGVDLSGHSIDRADFHQHDINQLNSLNNHGSRVHLTHHGKQRFGQLDKLFDSHSRSSSSSNSQSYGDDGNIGFGFLNIFSFGGGFNSQTQTQAASSDSPIVTMTLNVLDNAQNHLNSTRIDKERSGSSRTDNNSLDRIKTNTNNFNATKMDKDTKTTRYESPWCNQVPSSFF
ncbi:unnamed protein product [Rotaria magnacalcarata]|uniref:Uncharacterized protein n=1 Tax=Rotaria magnacalcarata TaxID=392030 RepID=A0A8S2JSK4_9BILA|nr:unnamed protein product [Rotaria magnacalcarata]CAF4014157.1 unnamed protein product [Rotaria magnacalcarata]